MNICKAAISCEALLKSEARNVTDTRKLTFTGVDGYDVYNISVPFENGGEEYIAGRVEKRDDELSFVRIFKKTSENTYEAVLPQKTFKLLQDPFVTHINGELILGGVQISSDPLNEKRIICWRTLFYKGKTPQDLELFAEGPNKMKDIRLTQLSNGKVGIFTRPQGKVGGLGQIGFIAVDSLDAVNEENILKAQIFNTHFLPKEWGGANDIHLLDNGLLGVIGHIACRTDDDKRHYYPMAFVFNPETLEHSPLKILATRSDFPQGPFKRPDLDDVLFTAGIIRSGEKKVKLYTGMSDCEAGCAVIDDPFTNV